jgi:hypothetical protein
MTAAELLARLARRPCTPVLRGSSPQDIREHREQFDRLYEERMRRRAEFDRALLLDAVAHYLSEDDPPYDDGSYTRKQEAQDALRAIVTEMRETP